MSRLPAGLPAALAQANPPRRRKKRARVARAAAFSGGGDLSAASSFPVFYDKSGKRLRRVVLATLTLLLAFGALVACMAPSALSPARPTTTSESWPREFLATGDPHHVPNIGEGPLTRLLRVEHPHTGNGDIPGPDPAQLVPQISDEDGDGISDDGDGDGVPDAPVIPELPDPPLMPLPRLFDPVTGEFVRVRRPTEERDEIGDKPLRHRTLRHKFRTARSS